MMEFVQPIRDRDKIEEIKENLKAHNQRNYIMFLIGINTGLRIGDILRLKVKDLKEKDSLTTRERKTGKQKKVWLTAPLKRELKPYLATMNDDDYVIQSREGTNKSLSRSQAYRILKSAASEVGLDEIGTHTLRKTFGYHFYKQTKNIAKLQLLFNHDEEKTTMRYIGITQDELDEAMKKYSI